MAIQTGTVVDWNDDRGFGFIQPHGGTGKIFFHISNYSTNHSRPAAGLAVKYSASLDEQGRNYAVEVRPEKSHGTNSRERRQKIVSVGMFCFFAGIILYLAGSRRIPAEIFAIYGVMSVISFIVYAKDKNAARQGSWRTSERFLHVLSLLGGWPGAAIAQSFLRHKSAKLSFRIVYWLTVAANCGVLYWLTTPDGGWLLNIIVEYLALGRLTVKQLIMKSR